jgi:hypothetical protein
MHGHMNVKFGEICRLTSAQFGNILTDIKSNGPQNVLSCRQIDLKQWWVIKIIYQHLFQTAVLSR